MKKIFKNKKGFTLVELLAVIVILAIIMVIATQQIGKVIAGARADSFVETYQMIEKQVNTYLATDQDSLITCDDTDSATTNDCSSKYGVSNDYKLKVESELHEFGTASASDKKDIYKITLEPNYTTGTGGTKTYTGKFANMDLTKNGKASVKNSSGTLICEPKNVSNNAFTCDAKVITGYVLR